MLRGEFGCRRIPKVEIHVTHDHRKELKTGKTLLDFVPR
jgi:hypothetical protein